jgi:beta-glucosidase
MAGKQTGFPKNFIWGAATAAYQIEGAAAEDGRGPSIWDLFCRAEDRILESHTGDVACDHYHRWKEDVALMKALGLKAYRFSVAWPRVIPGGVGTVNAKGLAFYDRLVDELLAAGITPFVTLYHWDFPDALERRGGWLNRDVSEWFADYTTVVAGRLSDRVAHWITLNEPDVFINLGYRDGVHAPGHKLGMRQWLLAVHHAQMAHGRGVVALRAAARRPVQVGIAPSLWPKMPATDRPADVAAARRMQFTVAAKDIWSIAWWLDPVLRGRWPADGVKHYAGQLPEDYQQDARIIRQPVDFLGVNTYSGLPVKVGRTGETELLSNETGEPRTRFNWPVRPAALYWSPRWLYERYRLPVYITENGMSGTDWVALDGGCHDPQRIDFTRRYLRELRRAIGDGVDVRGYFHWSLLDNFEWAHGYRERFGLVHVDFATRRRTPKDSAWWYRDTIASNGRAL